MKTNILPAVLAAAMLVTAAGPAFADRDDWHHNDRDHRYRAYHHVYRPRPYVTYQPGYVYAPPPVVYAPPPPPPVVAVPSLNFMLNFH